MSDSDTKQIEGVCDEISEKNGWTTFAVNVGSQYPVRLSTKLPALVEQGRQVGSQRAVWTYKETQGGENPHKPGTFYTNRYLDRVEAGATIDTAAATPGRARAGATDRSIERQVIIKEMVQHYPGVDKLDGPGWWALMARLDDFMVNGVGSAPEVAVDDDIPFA